MGFKLLSAAGWAAGVGWGGGYRRSRTWSSARERRVSVVPSERVESRFPIRKSRFSRIMPLSGMTSLRELYDKFKIRTLGTRDAKPAGKLDNFIDASSRYCRL